MIPHVNPTEFLGLSLDDARNKIIACGHVGRLTKVPLDQFVLNNDYDPLRINLRIQDNIVIEAYKG